MTAICPICSQHFATSETVCPLDGSRLLLINDVDPMLGTELDGRYRIERKLGEGGMGAVYVGVQMSVERDVAIKVLRPEAAGDEESIKRFGREAQIIARLTHANVVQLIDFGRAARGLFYLVMELVRGRTLSAELAQGLLASARVATIVGQVCDALTEAHALGIVHRDLKPDNILLVAQAGNPDYVKVLDFGIAKVIKADKPQAVLTAAGSIIGTPQYMSPEQIDGAGNIGPAADLYALAVIVFEMLTGKPPFVGETQIQVLIRQVKEPPPRLTDRLPGTLVPEALEQFIAKGLAKVPSERCVDAQQFKAELRAALAQVPPGSTVRGLGVGPSALQVETRDSVAAAPPPPPPPPSALASHRVPSGAQVRHVMTGRMPDPGPTPTAPLDDAGPAVPLGPPPRRVSTAYNQAPTLAKSSVIAARQTTVPLKADAVAVSGDSQALTQAQFAPNTDGLTVALRAEALTGVTDVAPTSYRRTASDSTRAVWIGLAAAVGLTVALVAWLTTRSVPAVGTDKTGLQGPATPVVEPTPAASTAAKPQIAPVTVQPVQAVAPSQAPSGAAAPGSVSVVAPDPAPVPAPSASAASPSQPKMAPSIPPVSGAPPQAIARPVAPASRIAPKATAPKRVKSKAPELGLE